MGFFSDDSEQARKYNEYGQVEHQASVSHELIGGAAAYEAMRAYEKHCAENGKPQSHAEARELLAGLTGAIVDRMVETKGLDLADREKAKYEAHRQASEAVQQDFY